MSNATESNSTVVSRKSALFKASPREPKYRSKRSYATAMYSSEQRYGYSLNEDERCFLRQVLVSSGMGRGEMLALLG